MSIQFRDPLTLLAYQTGLLSSPLTEEAATGQSELDSQQRAITLGEPVPIVFCRRVGGVGGVFVSPGATEGRFANNGSTNELTVNLHLVLSEGELPALQLRDVFQRACRVGTWVQTYNRRAGTWTPGNFITAVAGTEFWNCPYYCGTSGTYPNMTTLSYTNTHADGDDTWDKQVHCFVRNGMQVTRIIDSVTGSSNNVVDLALYLIRQSSRFPESMIDTAAMLVAAQFTNTNGLFYNGEFKESTNLEDWLQKTSFDFLLRLSDKNGKKAFRPRLPINEDYTIKTTAISWVFAFTEEHLVPDGFEINYIPLADRKAIAAQMLWRQQPENDIGLIRTTTVRFAGEAANGPYEQYDLSQFCTSENHAVKVGAYIVAKRKYITHTLRIRVKPDAFNSTLSLGDIVRVQLRRDTDVDPNGFHDYLYEVERINKTISGVVELDLMHFPIDSQGRSLVARQVAAATGAGYVLPTGRNDFSCDIDGRDEDETPLADVGGNLPDLPDAGSFDVGLGDLGGGFAPSAGNDNPADPFDGQPAPEITGGSGPNGAPLPGETLGTGNVCDGQYNEWYLCPVDNTEINQDCQLVSEGVAAEYVVSNDALGKRAFVRGRCPDPSSPDGFGTGNDSQPTPEIGGGAGNVTGAGEWSIRRYTSPLNLAVRNFTTINSGFSLWFEQNICAAERGKISLAYFNTSGTFVKEEDVFGMTCEFYVESGQFLASLWKKIDGVYVFQYNLYN